MSEEGGEDVYGRGRMDGAKGSSHFLQKVLVHCLIDVNLLNWNREGNLSIHLIYSFALEIRNVLKTFK